MSDREKLPKTRYGLTHKFVIFHADREGKPTQSEYYITANVYPDGRLGELFVKPSQKDDAMMDQWSRALSVCVQRGATMLEIQNLFAFVQFDPQGRTDNPKLPSTKSPVDYVARWLALEFTEPKKLYPEVR